MPGQPAEKRPRDYAPARSWFDAPVAPDAPSAVVYAHELARALHAEWQASGMSAADFAERIQTPRRVFDRLIRGHQVPSLATIARIEDALDASLWPGRDAIAAARRTTADHDDHV